MQLPLALASRGPLVHTINTLFLFVPKQIYLII